MGISDGREHDEFHFADFYAAVTASLPTVKRKTHNPPVNRGFSGATRFIPWIRRSLERFGYHGSGAGQTRQDESSQRSKGKLVSLPNREIEEKLSK